MTIAPAPEELPASPRGITFAALVFYAAVIGGGLVIEPVIRGHVLLPAQPLPTAAELTRIALAVLIAAAGVLGAFRARELGDKWSRRAPAPGTV